MAAILSSVATRDPVTQRDGSFWVYEVHTDSAGGVRRFGYIVLAGFDYQTAVAARGASLNISLPLDEVASNIVAVTERGSLGAPTFNFSTAAQNFAALRLAYASATMLQAIMIGDFLSSLTSAQLQTAFGMTSAQVTTLRTNRLTPAATTATAIRAGLGQ